MLTLFPARTVRTQEPNVSCRFLLWRQGAVRLETGLRLADLAAQHAVALAVGPAPEGKEPG